MPREYLGRDAFIDELYLKKSFRRKGYCVRVLNDLTEEAQRLGVNAIHLEVGKE